MKTKEQFLKDVADHKMHIKQDNGLYRNIIFKRENSGTYWFGIQTWEGYLCIYGDMGTYVFSRTTDMFKFFRRDKLEINPDYWHEKLSSDARYEGSIKFSKDEFKKFLKEEFESYAEYEELGTKEELWKEIESEILSEQTEESLYRAAMDFRHKGAYPFQDFYEHRCTEYTVQFIWCLYAIVWAIQQYDKNGEC